MIEIRHLSKSLIWTKRFKPLVLDAGCNIHFHADKEVVGNWDRFRIEQVVVNLLSNAAKYAPGKPINVKLVQKGSEAILSVQDQGKGIPTEHQARIFQRFERVQGSEIKSGLGLGLFIVKEILSLHGGDIALNSRHNEGAEFIVRMPIS